MSGSMQMSPALAGHQSLAPVQVKTSCVGPLFQILLRGMTKTSFFSPKLFSFLKALKRNNSREWFKANQERYEDDVREPCFRFISAFAPRLEKISGALVANPSKRGGSLFRIHRDTRFSKDKSPYKTHSGIHFRHARAKDAHAPGFYLHLEPGNIFVGAGIWRPDGDTLGKIRNAISEKPRDWSRVAHAKAFRKHWRFGGDVLKRPPRGYDKEHPMIEDLKRKDFIVVQNLSQKETLDPGFLNQYASLCRSARPLMRFLTEAVELKW